MNIFLIRHGESESNVDRNIHHKIADHAIKLTDFGKTEARETGEILRNYLEKQFSKTSLPIRLWTSPYCRTRQTTEELLIGLSPYQLKYGVRENLLLVEQQAGLFDGYNDEECATLFPQEFATYQKNVDHGGRIFGRYPQGESRFDLAIRVYQSFGTFHRDAEKHGIDNIIIVSHGATIRAFIMMWLHLPYEWLEKEPNPPNCSIRLIQSNKDMGYIFDGYRTKRESRISSSIRYT